MSNTLERRDAESLLEAVRQARSKAKGRLYIPDDEKIDYIFDIGFEAGVEFATRRIGGAAKK